MKVLITGIYGFVGWTLADYLTRTFPAVELFGLSRQSQSTRLASSSPMDEAKRAKPTLRQAGSLAGDTSDFDFVLKVIDEVRPDKIFHLAAHSSVTGSWQTPAETLRNNILGQCNLLEAVRTVRDGTRGYDPAVLIAGSSEEYGLVAADELPIKETAVLRPLSPYGVSKVCQGLLGFQYWQVHRIRTIRSRAFNLSGPWRDEQYVDSNFARQIAAIEAGTQPPVILVGNLDAKRDFTDVRDAVRAYWLAAERGLPGEVYNICRGQARSVREILETLLKLSRRADITIEQDPTRLRPSEVPCVVGDSSKFRQQTGWQPEVDYLLQTLPDLLNFWRDQLTKKR